MEEKIKALKDKLENIGTRDLLGMIGIHFITFSILHSSHHLQHQTHGILNGLRLKGFIVHIGAVVRLV